MKCFLRSKLKTKGYVFIANSKYKSVMLLLNDIDLHVNFIHDQMPQGEMRSYLRPDVYVLFKL